MSNMNIMSFSPLWGEWHIKGLIGKGSFGAVYQAEKNEYGNRYFSAVKHISIPPENVTKETLVEDGVATDARTYSLYCDNLRDQIIKEINFCYTLRGNTNIVSYEDHCIIPKSSGIGYDIFIRMELLTGLTKYQSVHPMSESDVIKLGIDLCQALNVLELNHMIHRDIKPANIFVNSMGVFKLGDFGESKVLSNSSLGMTIKGTYAYMSPEISKGAPANITADIYSLGLVMYRLLNANRAPFLPVTGQPVDSASTENANIRRFQGEPFPPPAFCTNPALSGIIMKACAFNRQDRWQSPNEMKRALESLLITNNRNDTPTVPPQYQDNYYRPAQAPVYVDPRSQSVQPVYQQPAPPPKKNKSLLIGILIGAGVAIVAVAVLILVLNSGNNSNSSSSITPSGQQSGTSSYQESSEEVSRIVSSPESSVYEESREQSRTEESSREESHSIVTSIPEASKAASRTLGDFMASSDGELFKKVTLSSTRTMFEEQYPDIFYNVDMYSEGDNVLVFEYTMNMSGLTQAQLDLYRSNLESTRDDLDKNAQTSINALKNQHDLADFDVIYRYYTKDSVKIGDIYIAYKG